jgi:hypothetical protein
MVESSRDSDPADTDSIVGACFGLGWRMEELFSRYDIPVRPPRPYDPARLPGLSDLTSYDRQRLGLDQVDFVLGEVTAAIAAPAAVPLNLTAEARTRLDATIQGGEGAAARRHEYKAALGQLHVDLLVTFTAAETSYGKAYGLGRALADTTRPHQSGDELTRSFEQHRIGQLYVWLDELASLLPDHAALSVEQSLGWWEQAVTASAENSKLSTQSMPSNLVSPPSPWPRGTARLRPSRRDRSERVEPPTLESLTAAAARQGGLWRGVLTGEKLCIDMLTPQDYLRAGDRLGRHNATLVRQALQAFLPWLILLLLLLAAIVIVLVLIPGSAVARTATAAAASAGTFSGIWQVIRTRVTPIAAQLERPLWGTEMNTAAAEAITIPPVGTPQDPRWEAAFEKSAADVIAAATRAEPPRPAVPPGSRV